MNGFLKFLGVLLVVFLVAVPLLAPEKQETAQSNVEASTEVPATAAPSPPPAPAPTPAPAPRPLTTRNHMTRVKVGMSIEQCLRIIGTPGEKANPNQWGNSGVNAAFTWYAPDGRTHFTLGFRNGVLASKSMGQSSAASSAARERMRKQQAQTRVLSLEQAAQLEAQARNSGQRIVISVAAFQRLQPGMTYAQCVDIIGAEHPMARHYTPQRNAILNGQSAHTQTLKEAYKWQNPGGYFAEIAFHNGRMTRKSWHQGSGGGGMASGSSR